jgi:peptidoglycan/xylan/chitin deacetylase (PgdA/CDA1 family)
MKAKILLLCAALALLPAPLFAKLIFSGLDLSDGSRLLFRADSDTDLNQSAIFVSHLGERLTRQLTAFPEKMELIDAGRTIQVRNAFGALRIPVSGGLPQPVPGLPSVFQGSGLSGGRAEGMASSADGKWLLIVEPVTAAYGNLVLVDAATGARTRIAGEVERPDTLFPASWSPDSRIFVYARAGKLYYHSVGVTSHAVDERYRLIGEGAINAVRWSGGGDFFYLRGTTVYLVRGAELFARAVYADFLEPGQVAGKIPFEFDYNFDEFWIAPDTRSILLAKGGRNLFYFPLGLDDYSMETTVSLPYIMLPRSCYYLNVLWSAQGIITVIARTPDRDGQAAVAWRLVPGAGDTAFHLLEAPVEASALLSPDGTRAVLWGARGIYLYDYGAWQLVETLSSRPAYGCIWLGNGELVTGDSVSVDRIQLAGSGARGRTAASSGSTVPPQGAVKSLLCLSQADVWCFEAESERILAQAGERWYVTDGSNPWMEIAGPRQRPLSQVSGRYRVYLEKQYSGPYANIPLIRNTTGVGTTPLFQRAAYAGEPASGVSRELAVCFDLYDDAAGLPAVLQTLRDFGIKATFFINGEFIRRYPGAVQDIVEGGHETASLFFAPIDLSDARYRIDENFVTRGLARNEDEFFKVSGQEMSLIWHAPYYAVSEDIVQSAARSGYRTIGRDVDPLDWVTRENVRMSALAQLSAPDMIDRVMSLKKHGSIIPIRLGLLPGGRADYLYNRLGLLLEALIREGYSVVTVSTLIERYILTSESRVGN